MDENYNELVRKSEKFRLTPEQTHMKEQFDEVRAEILDRGNNQIRNLEAEFTNYDINWLRYRMTLPVKPVTTEPEINQGEEDGQKQDEN
jgi:hypothetical protein